MRIDACLVPGYIPGTLTNWSISEIHRESRVVELLVLLILQLGSTYIMEGVCPHGVPLTPISRDSSFAVLCADLILSILLFVQGHVCCCHTRCHSRADCISMSHMCGFYLSQVFFRMCVSPYSIESVSRSSSETNITFLKLP